MPWILTSATVRAMFMVLSSSLFIMRCINIQRPELACGIPVSLYYYSSAGILIGNTGTTNNSRRRLFSATTNNPRAGILRVARRGGVLTISPANFRDFPGFSEGKYRRFPYFSDRNILRITKWKYNTHRVLRQS